MAEKKETYKTETKSTMKAPSFDTTVDLNVVQQATYNGQRVIKTSKKDENGLPIYRVYTQVVGSKIREFVGESK